MKKEIITMFKNEFSDYGIVEKAVIRKFFERNYPNLSESSFLWKLYDLKELGFITKLSNDQYKINDKVDKLKFNILHTENHIFKTLIEYNQSSVSNNFFPKDEVLISLWSVNEFNRFTNHQVMKNYHIIELDKYRTEDLFYYLKDKLGNKFYITTDYKKDMDHINSETDIIIILPLLKRAPLAKANLKKTNFVTVPKIEKLLVDIFHDKNSLSFYDFSSIKEIYENIYEKYNIDFTTLFYYARNKGIKDELVKFVQSTLGVNKE